MLAWPRFATSGASSKLGRLSVYSGVVQLVAHGPLEPRILVRVQAPEPFYDSSPCRTARAADLSLSRWSIGAALTKEIVKQSSVAVFLLDHPEGNLHQIDFEMGCFKGDVCRQILGDISAKVKLTAEIQLAATT